MDRFFGKSSTKSPPSTSGRSSREGHPRNAPAPRREPTEIDAMGGQHHGDFGRPFTRPEVQESVNPAYMQAPSPQGRRQEHSQTQLPSYVPAPTPAQQASNTPRSRNKKPTHAVRAPLFRKTPVNGPKNIVIFGETGTGKSSLINMLSDNEVATVSNSAVGCTFESACYPVSVNGVSYNLWDTAGLNEGEAGSVPADEALHHLRDLVDKLKDGLSLLVYCIRGARYRDIIKVNYDLFTEIICQGEVPVVIVITGLENEANMEDWWVENEKEFTSRNMRFEFGHACVTTSKGKKNMFEEEYEESKDVVRALIGSSPDAAWVVDSDQWFSRITDRIRDYYDEYNGHSRSAMLPSGVPNEQTSTSLLALAGSMLMVIGQKLMRY